MFHMCNRKPHWSIHLYAQPEQGWSPFQGPLGKIQDAPWTGCPPITGLTYIERQMLTFTPRGNLGIPIHLIHTFLDCRSPSWTQTIKVTVLTTLKTSWITDSCLYYPYLLKRSISRQHRGLHWLDDWPSCSSTSKGLRARQSVCDPQGVDWVRFGWAYTRIQNLFTSQHVNNKLFFWAEQMKGGHYAL